MPSLDPLHHAIRDAARLEPRDRGTCVTVDELTDYYLDSVQSGRVEEIREHLTACGNCLDLARDLAGFMDARPPSEGIRRRLFSYLRTPGLAIAALLCVALAAGALWKIRLSERDVEVLRSVAIEKSIQLIAPKGDLREAPRSFEWQPVPGAARYEFEIRDTRLTLVWSDANVQTGRVTLSEDASGKLVTGEYAWRVTAVDSSGRRTSSSFDTFRIAPR